MSPLLIGFVVYLVAVLVAGGLTYRLNNTQEDFLLAGRRLNPWVATFSERASGESAWLLLGLPAAVMTIGLVQSWTAVGCVLGIGFSWFVVASGLRRETERYGALTLPEYLATKFGPHGKTIRVLASLIVLFFYSFYVAAQFNGAGKVLNITFGIESHWGMAIGAVIIIAYTMMGGFFAVAWTDFIQAILMIGTLVILPIVAYFELSHRGVDISATVAAAGEIGSWTGGKTGLAAFAAVLGGLSWGFGYSGQPHTLTRYMSMSSQEGIKRGRIIALAWAIPAFIGAVGIGVVGVGLYETGHFPDSEQLMPGMAADLLPPWLAGLFISGAIAAMMSTADSQLLVGTSAVAEDLLHRTFGIELEPKKLVLLSRAVTIGLGAAGFFLAISSQDLIMTLVSYAWSGLGSSFGPAVILSLHWKRTNGPGVIAGMITGALTTVIWSNLPYNELVTERIVSFAFATIAVVVVSLSTKPAEAEPAEAQLVAKQ